jgi:hypothetical protein
MNAVNLFFPYSEKTSFKTMQNSSKIMVPSILIALFRIGVAESVKWPTTGELNLKSRQEQAYCRH